MAEDPNGRWVKLEDVAHFRLNADFNEDLILRLDGYRIEFAMMKKRLEELIADQDALRKDYEDTQRKEDP